MEPVVLVVDDEPGIRWSISQLLKVSGYEVAAAETAEEGLEKVDARLPDLVLADVRMPGMDGMSFIKELHKRDPLLPVIAITGYGTVDRAVEAMKIGAVDFLEKPYRKERLREAVKKALEGQALRKEIVQLEAEQDVQLDSGILIGKSKPIREIYRVIKQLANSPNSTVLIQGESGTGKELIARAVHYTSARRSERFVEINCAALTKELLESELFGHEKGSFTGATTAKPGLFEVANKGTIFLDEIGEMNVALQAKLLRVLQEKKFKRVGGTENIEVDVRIIASTNRDLEQAVEQGEFREDLYHRVRVIPIHVPPLRERKEDIPLIAKYYLQKFNRECDKDLLGISPEAEELMENYAWSGNVRELKNVIERAVTLEQGKLITPRYLMLKPRSKDAKPEREAALADPPDFSIATMERLLIRQVLQKTLWQRNEAARILGIHRTTLSHKIKEYDLATAAVAT